MSVRVWPRRWRLFIFYAATTIITALPGTWYVFHHFLFNPREFILCFILCQTETKSSVKAGQMLMWGSSLFVYGTAAAVLICWYASQRQRAHGSAGLEVVVVAGGTIQIHTKILAQQSRRKADYCCTWCVVMLLVPFARKMKVRAVCGRRDDTCDHSWPSRSLKEGKTSD